VTDELPESPAARTRKRPAVKTPSRQNAGKVKSTIHLSVEASQRLSVHATMLGLDRSELVEQLVRDHLKRFVVSDRGGPAGTPGEQHPND
jgi:ribbon-helix-helix CopG family protein